MDFMWLIVGLVLIAAAYTVQKIASGWSQKLPGTGVTFTPPRFLPTGILQAHAPQKRQIKWISMKECESLVRGSDDVIFVAIRRSGEKRNLSFATMSVLSIPPNQLVDVLPWLSPESSVVLLGDADLCTSIVESLDEVAGTTPIYALKTGPARSGVI